MREDIHMSKYIVYDRQEKKVLEEMFNFQVLDVMLGVGWDG